MLTVVAFVFGCLVINVGGSPRGDTIGIMGGYNATSIPYQVSLTNSYNRSLCGAAILNERWVLTAAHCTVGESFKVVVGSNYASGGQSYLVEKIINHENYVGTYAGYGYIYDISLIKVSSDIKFSDLVKRIPLPEQDSTGGEEVIASGWGRLSNGGARPSNLQVVTLKTLSNEQCEKEFNGQFRILPSQLCTLMKSGQGTCMGDSGGPLVHGNVLVGIVSWGIPCAVGSPDVFTRVYHFKNWIHENMSK